MHDTKLKLTPQAGKLSAEFAQNKGKLPWPVTEGIITEHFGTNPHPLLPNIEINNNGEYYTVYAHLGVVDVAKGDKLIAQQSIGTVYTDFDENKTTVHLEIWDGNTKLNPARWLARK